MDRDQVRHLIDGLEAEVNNGGLDQFFFNNAGDDAAATMEALALVGASRTADILRRACAKFPGGMPPADRFARQHLLEEVSPDSDAFEQEDEDFLVYEEDLAGLVAGYAQRSVG